MAYCRIDIDDMSCWVFRMAQKRWHKTPSECAALFKKYNLFNYIEECYEILHVSGYECVVNDLEDILESKGVDAYAN